MRDTKAGTMTARGLRFEDDICMASDALSVGYIVRRSHDGLTNRQDLQRTQKLAESFNLLLTAAHAVHDLPEVLVIVVLGPPLWHRRCTHNLPETVPTKEYCSLQRRHGRCAASDRHACRSSS